MNTHAAPPEPSPARRSNAALTLGILSVILAGTALALTAVWLIRFTPAEPTIQTPGPTSIASSAPRSAEQAFTAAMSGCGIEQGHGAASVGADALAPAALAVRVPRVLDASGTSTEQFTCLAGALEMPDRIVDKMLIFGQEQGEQTWTTPSGLPLAVTWTRGPGGLVAVFTGKDTQI